MKLRYILKIWSLTYSKLKICYTLSMHSPVVLLRCSVVPLFHYSAFVKYPILYDVMRFIIRHWPICNPTLTATRLQLFHKYSGLCHRPFLLRGLGLGALTLVSCPAHTRLLARNGLVKKSNFLGLLPKPGIDQWDYEIGNYYVVLYPYFFLNGLAAKWSLLDYIVTKACASPRNSTWLTRLFLLVRGWGLGTRLP